MYFCNPQNIKMTRKALETEQKALEINLDDGVYGTFAEIGAGQEVARHFFQAGAAAGTIAKTMSAYDKVYSDNIYGLEASGRYVCESRLYKMLDHEYELMHSRLQNEMPGCNFFVFADTVSTLNYSKTVQGDGWMGLRFQLNPDSQPNDIVLHVKMLDNDTKLQQQAVGILGVNLVYACYRYNNDAEVMLESLLDNLHDRIVVDMVRITGPEFKDLDNRWLSLMLVKHKLSNVAIFDPDGRNVHASEFLYKKNVLIVRGSFRPATLVNEDMIKSSWQQFRNEPEIDARAAIQLAEIILDNLIINGELDEKDFLDRAEVLCAMGQTVVVSNCKDHQKLITYFSDFKIQKLGIVIGVRQLLEVIDKKFQSNRDGRLLTSFGELFTRNIKMYVYPMMQEGSEELMTSVNLPVPEGIKFLYQHLLDNGQIVDLSGFNAELLHIFSKDVLELLQADEDNWEDMVPEKVSKLIKEKCLFGFPSQQLEFEY